MHIPEAKADETTKLGVKGVLEKLEKESLPQCVGWMQEHRKLAEKYGLDLITDEGGQHTVGVQGGENNDKLTEVFTSANRHPRM